MKNKLKIAAGLALLALAPTAAMAHTDVSIGLNLGGGYYAPEPVYVAPPPPIYYYSQPRYYGPAVRYEYYDRDRHEDWERRHWDRGEHRGHHDDHDRDDD